jgi:hypothetical protein
MKVLYVCLNKLLILSSTESDTKEELSHNFQCEAR